MKAVRLHFSWECCINSVASWWKRVRGYNSTFVCFLVATLHLILTEQNAGGTGRFLPHGAGGASAGCGPLDNHLGPLLGPSGRWPLPPGATAVAVAAVGEREEPPLPRIPDCALRLMSIYFNNHSVSVAFNESFDSEFLN